MQKQNIFQRNSDKMGRIAVIGLGTLLLCAALLAVAFGTFSTRTAHADMYDDYPQLTGNETLKVTPLKSGARTEFELRLENVTKNLTPIQLGAAIMPNTDTPGLYDYSTICDIPSAFGTYKASFGEAYLAENYDATIILAGTYRVWFRFLVGMYPLWETVVAPAACVVTVSAPVAVSTLLPPDPFKPGYTFDGWYLNESLTQPYDGRPVTENLNLYAKFSIITYTLTYHLNDGTLPVGAKTSFTIEDYGAIVLPRPTKQGYKFVNWYGNAELSGTGGSVIYIMEDTLGDRTFYAKWDYEWYAVNYELNGGEFMGTPWTMYSIESETLILTIPSRAGYTFGGWFENAECSGTPVTAILSGSTGVKTYHAKWNVVTYTISYVLNGGELPAGHRTTYTIEDSGMIVLPRPEKTGSTFDTWYTNASFSGGGGQTMWVGVETLGDKTFYARYELVLYTITFYVDNEVYRELQVPHGSVLGDYALVNQQTLETVPLFTDLPSITAYSMSASIESDTTLYAQTAFDIYVPLNYSVNGEITKDLRMYNSLLTDLRTVEVDGYTFGGWFYDAESTRPVLATDTLRDELTIYAKLTKQTFWSNVGAFLLSWWWIFAVVAAGVGAFFIIRKVRAR